MLTCMFVVTEAEAAAIRAAFNQGGELSAAVELRRLFPGISDAVTARAVRPDNCRLDAAASAAQHAQGQLTGMAGCILALATAALLLAPAVTARPAAVQPEPSLTPGEIASSDPALVRQRGYSRAVCNAMPRGLRASVYRAYGCSLRPSAQREAPAVLDQIELAASEKDVTEFTSGR